MVLNKLCMLWKQNTFSETYFFNSWLCSLKSTLTQIGNWFVTIDRQIAFIILKFTSTLLHYSRSQQYTEILCNLLQPFVLLNGACHADTCERSRTVTGWQHSLYIITLCNHRWCYVICADRCLILKSHSLQHSSFGHFLKIFMAK